MIVKLQFFKSLTLSISDAFVNFNFHTDFSVDIDFRTFVVSEHVTISHFYDTTFQRSFFDSFKIIDSFYQSSSYLNLFSEKAMTVEKHHVLSFFLNDSISKTFINLQNVAQTTLHAMKDRKFYRFFSSHGFSARQSFSFGQFIDFDDFKHSIGFSARHFFSFDQFIDFDGFRHSIGLSFFGIRTRQSFANFLGARQFFNFDRFIDFDSFKHPIGFGGTRRFFADFLSARFFSFSQSIDFAFSLQRFSKRHRFTEIINSVKRQIVQSSVLEEADIFFTASTRLIGFFYSRVVTQESRQECDAFSRAYDRFLNVMNKDEHGFFWFSRGGGVMDDTQHSA